MKNKILTIFFTTFIAISFGQTWRKPISRNFYTIDGKSHSITYFGYKKCVVNSENQQVIQFFTLLPLGRLGRKQLNFLLKTNAKVLLNFSNKICVTYKDGKYRIAAGLTGQNENQSNDVVLEYYQPLSRKKRFYVFKENSLSLYFGCIEYIKNPNIHLDTNNVILFNLHSNQVIHSFSMDTIKIEPFMNPDFLYKNVNELFYFAGIHEIEHLKPDNIIEQILNGEIEKKPMQIEIKAFKRRKQINRKMQLKFKN